MQHGYSLEYQNNTSSGTDTNIDQPNNFINQIRNYIAQHSTQVPTNNENETNSLPPVHTINTPYGTLSYGTISNGTINPFNTLHNTSTLNNPNGYTDINNITSDGYIGTNNITPNNTPLHYQMYTFTAPLNNNTSETNTTNGSGSSATSQFFSQLLNILGNSQEMDDIKIVCTKEELENMRVVSYGDFKTDELCKTNQCNICLDEYNDKDQLMVLNCKHYFHQKCSEHWLGKCSHKCPICRQEASKGKADI